MIDSGTAASQVVNNVDKKRLRVATSCYQCNCNAGLLCPKIDQRWTLILSRVWCGGGERRGDYI